MKILYVGNCNHYFNRKLADELKQFNDSVSIDFFSIVKPDEKFYLPYKKIFDCSVNRNSLNFLLKLPGFYSFYCYRKWNKELIKVIQGNNYDYIHLQSLESWQSGIEKFHDKIIITVWGSDFLRSTKSKLLRYEDLIRKAYKITFASDSISSSFNKIFKSIEKHFIVRFGLKVFDEIDKINNTYYNQNKAKTVITVGYNRHPAQQHLKVINELAKMPKTIKSKIKVVFPLTYGPQNTAYLNSIKEKIFIADIEFEFYDNFLTEIQMAELTLNSDIMIQLQTTDAFSGTMQEYMYAGNVIVTGKWLNYSSLRNENVYFHEIENFDNLSILLCEIIEKIDIEKMKIISNRSKLKAISSWDANIVKWYNLYK